MSPTNHVVQVGEEQYTLRPFKGYKAIRIGRVVAAISDAVPDVLDAMAAFERKYEANNNVRITRVQALIIPEFKASTENVPNKVWEESGGVLELPQSPSTGEQIAAVFPMIFRAAEPLIVTLLALVATTDAALREADETGDDESVDELLRRNGKRLLHEGTLDELLSLAVAAYDVIGEQFADKGGELGKLRAALGMATAPGSKPEASEPYESPTEPSKTKKPNSSTASRARTDGPAKKLSTGTVGAS